MVQQVFFRSLWVLVLSSTVSMLGVLVDGIVIGQFLPDAALAAYGIAIPATVLAIGVANVISSGASSFCGRSLGSGRKDEADRYFSAAFFGGILLGLLISLALLAGMDSFCVFLGAPPQEGEIFSGTRAFLLGYLPAIPAILLVQLLSSIMYLENARRLVFLSAVAGTAVNVGGVLLNVYAFQGGMGGMALVTSVSYYVMLAMLLPRFFGSSHLLTLRRGSFGWRELWNVWRVGLPSADLQVCSMLRSIVLNHLLLSLAGAAAVTAFSIRMSMYNLYGSFVIGFGMAALILVSFYIGEEDVPAMREVLRVAIKYGLISMTAMFVLVEVLAVPLVALYTSDGETADMAVMSVRLFAASLPLFVLNSILAKYYQAMHFSALSHAITILQNFVYVCLLAFALGQMMSVNGVWLSFLLAEVAVFGTILLTAAVKLGHLPRSLDDLMLLPEGFGASSEEQLLLSCRTREEASAAAAAAADFLRARGAVERTALRVSLCIEELLLNIVTHGISDMKKEAASIRVLDKPKEWVVCLQDNARPFDPKKWMETHQAADGDGTLGLRLVFYAADNLSYARVLDMNQIKIAVGK